MTVNRLQPVLQHLQKLVGNPSCDSLPDRELLSRFITHREESAFSALVERHATLVLGVCRRVLQHQHDAEDACQATFLILARKAASIHKRESLSSWLHGVAFRIASKLKQVRERRRDQQPLPVELTQMDSEPDLTWREAQQVIDQELRRLPEALRLPLVLCYLQGKTRDEAAQELGWSLSTLRGRLERGRDRLRIRLEGRGLSLATALPTVLLTEAVSSAMIQTTTHAAITGTMNGTVAVLVEGGLRTMSTKFSLLGLVFVLGLIGTGTTAFLTDSGKAEDKPADRKSVDLAKDQIKRLPQEGLPLSIAKMVDEADRIVILEGRKEWKVIKGPIGLIDSIQRLGHHSIPEDSSKRWICFLKAEEEGTERSIVSPLQPEGWFIPYEPEMEKKIRANLKLPAEWGDEVDGLRFGIRPRQSDFKSPLEQSVTVELVLQNVGLKEQRVLQHRSNISDYWLTSFLVTPERKPKIDHILTNHPWGFDQEDFPALRKPATITLQPGEVYIHTARLERWPELLEGNVLHRGRHFDTGTYSIQAVYWVSRERVISGKVVLEGKLKSNIVKIRITDDEKRWGAAIEGVQARLRVENSKSPPKRTGGVPQTKRLVEEKLNRIVSIDLKDKPFDEVLEALQKLTDLNMVLDVRALGDEQISPKQPVNLRLNDVTVKTVLKYLLELNRLAYVVEENVIRVTTEKGRAGS